MTKYDGKLLNLASKFVFVCFYDGKTPIVEPTNGKLMGKVINIKTKQTYYVPNLTDALVLYLLCRETNDFIPYEKFNQLIKTKFASVTDSQIEGVLDWLDQRGALDTTGTTATTDPDPLQLFTAPKISWNPKVPLPPAGNLKDFNGNHGHSLGYLMFTIWR